MAAVLQESRMENVPGCEQSGWRRFGDCLRAPMANTEAPAREQAGRMDAALIGAFIEQGHVCGGIDAALPLNIIDLSPDNGERAWRVLGALERVPQAVCYLAVCASAEAAAALLAHPFLQTYRAAQRLTAIVWQGEEMSGAEWGIDSRNPFVILAHGAFSRLRHDLFACHYGELLEAWTSPLESADGSDSGPAIDWRSHVAEAVDVAASVASTALLAHYAKIINSAAVLLPTGAMHCLQGLIDASKGRYLLLASDEGISTAAQVRLGALMPTSEMLSGRCTMPVNFDALSHWQRSQGAQVRTADEGKAVHQLVLHDAGCPQLADCLPGLQRLHSSRECAQAQLAGMAAALGESLSPEHAFVLLRTSDDSPQVFLALAPVLASAALTLQAETLPLWRRALQRACAQYYPAPEDEGFFRSAARVAMSLDAWGLAADMLEQSMGLYGATLQDLVMSARCHEVRGRTPLALSCIDLACHELADDEALNAERERLGSRLARWNSLGWYRPELAADGPLRIEPLGPEHAAAFLYQYRDPQIGMMTRLPVFESEMELGAWMAERRQQPARADFAVMHEEYGFAGVVSANWCGSSAFFHFWIGADFQGAGHGVRAAQLLIGQLQALNIRQVFTAAYGDNRRSVAALHRLGFEVLPCRAVAPEDDMLFFCRTLGKYKVSVARKVKVLRDFCVKTQSVFEFADDIVHVA